MPAAKRYTETQLGEFLEALDRIPAGKPPEPDFNKDELLDAMRERLRQRHLEDHVPIEQIVAELNAKGLSVKGRDIKKRTQGPDEQAIGGKRPKASPVKRRKAEKSTDTSPATATGVRGGLQIDQDEDEV